MKLKEKFLNTLPLIIISIFFLIVTLYIENKIEKNVIQQNLMWITPIFFALTLGIILISFFLSIKDIKKIFKNVDKKTWIVVIIIFLCGMSLRTFASPHTHRLFYDEDIYLNIGQNIAKEGRVILCNYGNQEKCFEGIYNKQPNGYSFLMSPIFIFNASESAAHYLTAFISSLTIPMIFLIGYLLFENKKIGILSSLIFSLIPITIIWAPTTTAGSVSIFFISLTLFSFLCYFKTKKTTILLLSFSTLAYAIQVRPEGIMFLIVIFISFFLLNKEPFKDFEKRNFLIFFTIFFILIVPHMLHTSSVKSEGWGASGNKLGLEYVENNLNVNGMFFFKNIRFPVLFTILGIIGLYPFKGKISLKNFLKGMRTKSILIVWFLIFFVLYLLFYAGSFDYGVDVRFSLNLYIPLALLGGCGAYLISKNINKLLKKEYISISIISIIIIVSFVPFYEYSTGLGEKAWDARLAHDFVVEEMKEIDDECWIFTHVPSVILVNGKNSLQAWYAQNKEVRENIMKEDCVMFYEEYWCSSEPWKSGPCKYFHDNFDMEVYSNVTGRYKKFTLYKIK